MKINFATVITDLKDEPVLVAGVPLTLRSVCADALINPLQGDEKEPGPTKAGYFNLAIKFNSQDECDLTVEEVATIKKRVGAAYGPLIVGRAYQILEGGA